MASLHRQMTAFLDNEDGGSSTIEALLGAPFRHHQHRRGRSIMGSQGMRIVVADGCANGGAAPSSLGWAACPSRPG